MKLKNQIALNCFRCSVCVLSFLMWLAPANAVTRTPELPKLAVKSYILQDFHSGKILAELASESRVEPASLTKMMTAYVVDNELKNGNIKLTDEVKVSEKAWRMQGSRMFIEVNKTVTVEDLMHGVIIQSGNDASVALAEFIAGSEESFASMMNQYAEKLDMKGTHYVNATGLPHEDHYTTARDLAILSSVIIREFPEHYALYSVKEFTYNNIKQHNRNKLLWQDKFVDGIKTGHTNAAGYCLAASAKRDDMRLVSVVLGANSESARAAESQKLLTYGFRFYETHQLYKAGAQLTSARLWKGSSDSIALGISDDLYITIPRGQYKALDANMNIVSQIIAPVTMGQIMGSVNISLGKNTLLKRDLVSLRTIDSGGFVDNLIDEVKLFFESYF